MQNVTDLAPDLSPGRAITTNSRLCRDIRCAILYREAPRPAGGIGRRSRFRSCRREVWGFESLAGHHWKPDVAIPQKFLAYPVLIEVAGSHGSGFFFSCDNTVYLVSAKHVLFKDSTETYTKPVIVSAADTDNIKQFVGFEMDCVRMVGDGNLLKHATADVAVARLARLMPKMPPAKAAGHETFRMVAAPGIAAPENAPSHNVTGLDKPDTTMFDNVQIGSDILLFGYPTSLAGPDFFEKNVPLLRTGIVAGKINDRQIVIDCPVYFGNSGALVVERLPSGDVKGIGVASRMVPFKENLYSAEFRRQVGTRYENSGYAIVEPMDRVLEVISEFTTRDFEEDVDGTSGF